MGADPTPALQGRCPAWNPNLKKFDLISLLNVQAHFFGDSVNILVKHHSSVLRWKNQVVHQRPHFVTLVNVFAHPERFVGDLRMWSGITARFSPRSWDARLGARRAVQLAKQASCNDAVRSNPPVQIREVISDHILTWHDPAFASNWGVALDAAYPDYCHTYASHFLIWPPGASLPGGDFPQGMVGGPDLWERQYWLTRQIF